MFIPRLNMPLCLILFLSLFAGAFVFGQDEAGTGAFIIVSKEGDVKVLDSEGAELPESESAAGKTLLEGQTIKTGPSGKIILLLSTGTLTTVEQSSQFILEKFSQKPFERDENATVADLAAEPSNSEVKLKLTQGTVLFNVKKLNAGSTFEIESPIGIAGIRGTDGELEVKLDPGTGNYSGGVNMLSGNVSFQTPGGGSFNIGAGKGLQFQAAPNGQPIGQPETKPVPPEKTQDLSQKTNLAKDSSKDVKVGEMNQARQDATQRVKTIKSRREEKQEDKKPNDATGEDKKESPEEKPGNQKQSANEEKKSGNSENKEPTRAEKIQQKVKAVAEKRTGNEDSEKEKLLETDDRQTLARKGVVVEDEEDAKKLRSLDLDKEDLKQLSKIPEEERKELLQSNDLADLKEQIQDKVNEQTANENIQTYTTEERQFMQNLPDTVRVRLLTELDPLVVRSLIAFNYSGEEILAFLSDLSNSTITDNLPTTSVPVFDPNTVAEELIVPTEFLQLLSDSDNFNILSTLVDSHDFETGNVLSDELIQLGRQVNEILADTVPAETLSTSRIFTFEQLETMGSFFDGPVYIAQLALGLSDISNIPIYASRNIALRTSLDLSEIYQTRQKSQFAISAAESISVNGMINLSTGDTTQETYLSLLAAESIRIEPDSYLRFTGDHLNVVAWESPSGNLNDAIEIVNVSMEAGVSLALESMQSSLLIKNSNLYSRDEIMLRAFDELQLNSVQFSNQVREIYMQATTISLRNINFPDGSNIFLATDYGGIDGKYPTFPTGDANDLMGNWQQGRVNFIQNVRYNENVMNNRSQFDQFGQNIQITTRP